MDYFQILCGIVVILLSLYYYFTRGYDFWENLGIPGPRPKVFFGNMQQTIIKTKSIQEVIKSLYEEFEHEPMFGIFIMRTPQLILNDLDLIKDVLIRDFSVFASRGIPNFPEVEPLSQHLFVLEPERWKPLRVKLSPVFTSGKLKDMFPLMLECAEGLEKYMETVVARNEPIECRDLAAKFTTDVIGNCAFGINMHALSDEESEFRRLGKEVFATSTQTVLRNFCRQHMPRLYSMFGHLLQPKKLNEFFTKVIVDTIDYRNENNIVRPDFVNLLMEIKKNPDKLENIELTDSLLTAQAFLFFLAGFETSSSTMSHVLYELALNPEIQDKLREEIKENCAKNGRTVTYDQLKEMKYLDKVFRETLRKYPIVPVLMREATKNYTFKGTKITIPAGTKIWIPVYPIQWNPKFYPNPEVFDPERFNDDAVATRHPMTYLPFGDGPRNCIGTRFAHLQAKVGLITILRNYIFHVCEKTTIPFQHEPRSFILMLKGGVILKITKEKAV